jgi:AcrR family transcriptional regulator
MKTHTKLQAKERQEQILTTALKLAVKNGYTKVTRDQIGEAAKIDASLLSYHFGTMTQFRRRLLKEAITRECLPVIAQALIQGKLPNCSEELKARAALQLVKAA